MCLFEKLCFDLNCFEKKKICFDLHGNVFCLHLSENNKICSDLHLFEKKKKCFIWLLENVLIAFA
jgi:hypothetical protein